MTNQTEQYKKQAAEAAVQLVQPGMVVGLGHGSTVRFALEALAERHRNGEIDYVVGIPCSKQTEVEAARLGIQLADLNDYQQLDMTLDGADEIDPDLNLIKGGGGALLREKIVAQASKRVVIMADEGKLSQKLGARHDLPIEVLQFGWQRQIDFLEALGGKAKLRTDADGQPILSDQENYLLDCTFGPIADVDALARNLEKRSGIIEHGLFIGIATDVIVAGAEGLQHLEAEA